MIEITNQQRKIRIELDSLSKFAESAIPLVAPEKYFSISFVSDVKMASLNNEFRERNKTTDVLSFPAEFDQFDESSNFIGDIIISAEQAKRQAEENGLSLELEIKQLILHGILHLLGYDHETDSGEMVELELKFRDKLKIS